MKSLVQQLADFVVETKFEDLPDDVVHEAKRVILDSLGCALGGMATKKGSIAAGLARRLGGPPESSIIGTPYLVSCSNAAFANGELFNGLDFDNALRPAIHASPFVLPPALALGESKSSSGKDLIVSAVLGHEVSCRIASGLSGIRGFVKDETAADEAAKSPVYGDSHNAFGSTASGGKILGLDATRMANAFGIAGYNAPMQTMGQWHRSGTDALVKYASAGWMAQGGTTAALLAEMGYTGDRTVLDGKSGFWRFSGSEVWKPDVVLKDLGRLWYLPNTTYKLYPCCGIIAAPLDLFIGIVNGNRLRPEEIEQVKVWMHPLSGFPLWRNRVIENEVQAQFSIAYVFSLAAHGVGRGAEWQDPANMRDPGIRGFMDKVTANPYPGWGKTPGVSHSVHTARVDVTARGKTYSVDSLQSTGATSFGQHGAKDTDLVAKFNHNASGVLSDERIEEVVESIWSLENVKDISPLIKGLAGKTGA